MSAISLPWRTLVQAEKGLHARACTACGSSTGLVRLESGYAQGKGIAPQYGVMVADDIGIEVARPAPHRAMNLPVAA
ncbi:hypothetical protein [Aquincola sp. J276]|uniref:hypothetical protein n=1 Tax=Aquincola sp. J276 TaxID=2898432 RepID=UPI002150F4B4|nr:hypothetical protein [Aquincola sp. J276]MCR5864063.1 hypothetical protein [Aquincola sp. J276]